MHVCTVICHSRQSLQLFAVLSNVIEIDADFFLGNSNYLAMNIYLEKKQIVFFKLLLIVQ